MANRTVLVWFRNDLRIHDNEILIHAVERGDSIVPVYCFDPRQFQHSTFGFRKTGINRALFIQKNVLKLKQKLESLGSNLICEFGLPEEVLPKICKIYKIDEVYHHREVAFEETQVSNLVETALWKLQINLRHFIGHTLYHKEDLPFPIKDIPDSFQLFRKKAERESHVRMALNSPDAIFSPPIETSEIPSLLQLGFSELEIEELNPHEFEGGEDHALEIMKAYLGNPKNTLQESKLSPYIAVGALSPIRFYHEIMSRPEVIAQKKWHNRLTNNLLKRDYFRFMFKKHGNQFFKREGFSSHADIYPEDDPHTFEQWSLGKTGDTIIDKGMHQLNETGYITDQMRAILAHYWTHQMNGNWLKGAAWFEEKLIDYAPSTNYGNWSHVAGVGSSSRENTPINLEKLMLQI